MEGDMQSYDKRQNLDLNDPILTAIFASDGQTIVYSTRNN